MGINQGQYTGSRFALDIEGMSAGYLSSFQPPSYEAEEGSQSLGPGYVTRKMLGGPKIGDATATYNISQAGPFLAWMASLWNLKCELRDTAVHLANQNYDIKRTIAMNSCLINEISFPELKASDGKKHLEVTAKWRPGDLRFDEAGGKVSSDLGNRAKNWLVSNFEVHKCFGLETQWITSLGLPKLSAKVTTETYGELRLGTPLYSSIEFSSIKMEIGAAGFRQARQLAVKTIRDGHVHEDDHEPIIVDMMDQSMRTVLGTFTMKDCLLKKFEWAPKLEGGKDGMAVCTLEFLVEDFRFEIIHK